MFGLPLGEGALIFGLVYDFLPFMIYPIYNTLQKLDTNLIEAAQDLGANQRKVFTKIIIPLSMPGVYSGIIMVFMPTVSTFAISELLTHNKITLFGSLIQRSFSEGGITMWNYGAALSLILLVIIGLTSFLGQNDHENHEGGLV
jgi:spermidine/putrescine transport system permease protein